MLKESEKALSEAQAETAELLAENEFLRTTAVDPDQLLSLAEEGLLWSTLMMSEDEDEDGEEEEEEEEEDLGFLSELELLPPAEGGWGVEDSKRDEDGEEEEEEEEKEEMGAGWETSEDIAHRLIVVDDAAAAQKAAAQKAAEAKKISSTLTQEQALRLPPIVQFYDNGDVAPGVSPHTPVLHVFHSVSLFVEMCCRR